MARIYAGTSIEFFGGVIGGISVSGVVTFSASGGEFLLFSCNANPLLVKEGWEGLTFSEEVLTGPTESN